MEVVCRCFDALRELVDNLGKHFLTEDSLTEALDSMRVAMEGDALCQLSPEGDEDEEEGQDEEDDERFEHDSKLLGFLSECLSSFCKCFGEEIGV